MKKLLSFAVMACVVVGLALSLNSCERKANEKDYPIAGHTFVGEDATGRIQVTFNYDFTAVMIAIYPTSARAEYDWDMTGMNVEIKLKQAITLPTGQSFQKGDVIFSGPYDPDKQTIDLKNAADDSHLVYELVQ